MDDPKCLGLGLPNWDGWQPYWAYWLGESLGVLARGLFLFYRGFGSTFVVHVGRGFDPSGPTDMGSKGDLDGVPPFPFLIYSPAPA